MNTEVKEIPVIALKACESSQIHSHGHCPVTNTIRFRFKGKSGEKFVYDYHCTPEEYEAFTKAESLGTHFGIHFKNAKDEHGNLKRPHTKHEIPLIP